MNNIEERLWEYIDGTCTADEQATIEALIEQNQDWAKKHQELTAFHNEISATELDEPPMGFAYKVMEQIRINEARTPLKTVVSPYLVKGIAAFFILTIIAVLVFIATKNNLGTAHIADGITGGAIELITGGPVFKAFIYLDIILFLLFADAVIRKRRFRIEV